MVYSITSELASPAWSASTNASSSPAPTTTPTARTFVLPLFHTLSPATKSHTQLGRTSVRPHLLLPPLLAPFYQHVSAIAPYTAHHGSSAQALQDPDTKASVSHAARRGLSKSNKRWGDWIHLDDKTLRTLPKGTTVDIERRGGDEQAFEEAVKGRNGGLEKRRGWVRQAVRGEIEGAWVKMSTTWLRYRLSFDEAIIFQAGRRKPYYTLRFPVSGLHDHFLGSTS